MKFAQTNTARDIHECHSELWGKMRKRDERDLARPTKPSFTDNQDKSRQAILTVPKGYKTTNNRDQSRHAIPRVSRSKNLPIDNEAYVSTDRQMTVKQANRPSKQGREDRSRQAVPTSLRTTRSTNDQDKSRKAVHRESNFYPSSLRDFFYAGTARQSNLDITILTR